METSLKGLNNEIAFYCAKRSMRLDYIIRQVFEEWMGLSCRYFRKKEAYKNSHLPKINYSSQPISAHEFFLPDSQFLWDSTIKPVNLKMEQRENTPAFFLNSQINAAMPLDFFAFAFFSLSRYEEYLGGNQDEHDRFPSKASIFKQNDFLHLPVLDIWLNKFKEKLKQRFPQLRFKAISYQFKPTYDVDYAWAYRNKGFLRTIAGYLKDVAKRDKASLSLRWSVQKGYQEDPFFTFPWLDKLHEKHQLQPSFFFLLSDYSKYDKNIHWEHPSMKKLIQDLAFRSEIGIHPSYYTHNNLRKLSEEKYRLEQITERPISKSRQHFLRLKLPDTYRQLIKANIKEDYSMGYADHIGFRAGTSLPFFWYDLQEEKITDLLVHPFCVMDVSLKKYMKLSPEQAENKLNTLVNSLREQNGQCTSLWHNSSVSNSNSWEGWRSVYRKFVQKAVG